MKKPFTEYFPQNEAACRNLVRRLHHPSSGWAKLIEADDIWHDSFRKLATRNPDVENERSLFRLVKKTALNFIKDMGRRLARRKPLFEIPLPNSSVRSLIGSSMDTVVTKEPSPSRQAVLSEQLSMVEDVVSKDTEFEKICGALIELGSSDKPLKYAKIGRYVHMSAKQVSKSMKRLRSMTRQMF